MFFHRPGEDVRTMEGRLRHRAATGIGEFAYDDFVRSTALIKCGEVATRAAMPQIRAWMPALPATATAPGQIIDPGWRDSNRSSARKT